MPGNHLSRAIVRTWKVMTSDSQSSPFTRLFANNMHPLYPSGFELIGQTIPMARWSFIAFPLITTTGRMLR